MTVTVDIEVRPEDVLWEWMTVESARPDETPPPSLLVVDVGGDALPALRAAEVLLRAHKPLLWVVIDPAAMLARGDLASELHRFLAEIGYVGETVGGDTFRWYHPEGRRA